MKKLVLLLIFLTVVPGGVQARRRSRARDEKPRDLKVAIVDTLGVPLKGVPVYAFKNGGREAILSNTSTRWRFAHKGATTLR